MLRQVRNIILAAVLFPVLVQPGPSLDPLPNSILAEEVQPFDNFGSALAFDGSLLAVGAPGSDQEDARNCGAVYLFERTRDAWQPIARLIPDPPQPDGRFGTAIALDGDTLAVSAPYEYNPEKGNASGAVYLFTRSGRGWAQAARLSAENGAPFDLFGGAVALNGQHLAVGARNVDRPNGRRDSGAVYLFQGAGRDWTLQALLGEQASGFDHFGSALAFAGAELLVGAPDASTEGAPHSGQVFHYRSKAGTWTEHNRLTGGEIRPEARFGAALKTAGEFLAVLAPQEYHKPGPTPPAAPSYEPNFGAAHLFKREGDQWRWQARLIPEQMDEQSGWINSLALTADGRGARLALTGIGRGGVYSFELQGQAWQALPAIRAEASSGLVTGQALAASGDMLLMGNRLGDIPQPNGNALQSAGMVTWLDW